MAVLCAAASTASAQLEKGKILIGGSAGTYNSKSSYDDYADSKSRGITIAPMIGYFVSDNLVIGTALRYAFHKNRFSYDSKAEETNYIISPFARYYLSISPSFKFFGDFSVGIGKIETKTYNPFDDSSYRLTKENTYGTSLAPGLTFLPAKRWSVDLRFTLFNYSRNEKTHEIPNTNYYKTNQFSFGLTTMNPTIGVNFHL